MLTGITKNYFVAKRQRVFTRLLNFELMSIEEKRRLLLAFDELIRSKINGTALEYAKRLKISKSTFFRLLDYMRAELGTPIAYDSGKGRYIYEQEGMLFLGFVLFEKETKENFKKQQIEIKSYRRS